MDLIECADCGLLVGDGCACGSPHRPPDDGRCRSDLCVCGYCPAWVDDEEDEEEEIDCDRCGWPITEDETVERCLCHLLPGWPDDLPDDEDLEERHYYDEPYEEDDL